MNRRFFMQMLAGITSFLGLNKTEKNLNFDQVNEFKDIVYIDDVGKSFKVPIAWTADECEVHLMPLINIYRNTSRIFKSKLIFFKNP